MGDRIAKNSKAYRDYILEHTWECGIALSGGEVKSVRAGEVSFADSFARAEGGQMFLHNLHINPYLQSSYLNDDPDRPRKLLLHKKEILKIGNLAREKRMALIPTKIYFNKRGFIKIEIALGRGKKQYDKRETIKKRDIERGLKRALKMRKG